MPATLRSLLHRADLHLRLLTGAEAAALDEPLSWLHSSDLEDPTPFLADGQGLLTTGTQFGVDTEVTEAVATDYVARLRHRGVVALGFGTQVVRAGTPAQLVDACAAQGLPLFEVPYETSFIAVAQANADAVARDANARNAWALSAQRAISLAAMRPDGLGATIAELSRQLDGWVGLFDVSGRLDRVHPADGIPPEDLELLRTESLRLLRAGQRASLPVTTEHRTGFTLQTLGSGGHLIGVLAIANGGALDRAGREVVTAVIALAGLALQQNRELARARGLLRTGLLTMLSVGDPAVVDSTSREVWGPLPSEPVRIAAVDVPDQDLDTIVDLLELWVQDRPGHLFFAVDDALFLCVGADDTAVVEELVTRYDLHAGLSDGASYRYFGRARTEAVQALDRRREGRPGITEFGDLAREGVLAHLAHVDVDAGAVARAFLAPLLDHDRSAGTELTRTVREWLAQNCEYDRTAQALGIHRHTARARVEHAGRLLERDLSVFATRADLWAAFVVEGA
ncbi:PucR family transcriptional regulator [Curtobacterium pusillum]|uniref:PucR family transcriptional regulator n=1 Tax=Curtobacterium pusillum TaxID=69373 RepID=A0ABX2MBY3_9MICO|nr:PucR family transcriptional regulator [Curtobacterium pusillum]NUU15539.1 PucR family transcriptional regulator [Curtobacterium pusillum]GLK32742.1 PucR family transcriptional regulator [Curtobacterium pusillum]